MNGHLQGSWDKETTVPFMLWGVPGPVCNEFPWIVSWPSVEAFRTRAIFKTRCVDIYNYSIVTRNGNPV